jgi:hypothetical protein
MQSIESTLRNLDKLAIDQHNRAARLEKELADYWAQAGRPFEHEERLRQLLARQAELNSALDLDKGDQQAIVATADEAELERATSASGREVVAEMARAHMHKFGIAIREIDISERTAPRMGQVTARVVAKSESHIALSTAPNSFFVVPSSQTCSGAELGERLRLRFQDGRIVDDSSPQRGR